MAFDLLIKSGTVILGNELNTKNTDIGIKNGKISLIADNIPTEDSLKIINAQGLHVLPGLIDTQVHFREPGLTHKEDIECGTKAALQGGIIGVFEMPNTTPSTTTVERILEKITIAKNKSWSKIAFYAGATSSNIFELQNMEKIKGCCGVKIFMGSSTGQLLVESNDDLEKILSSCKSPIAVHCEDEQRLQERKSIVNDQPGDVSLHPLWRDELTALNATQNIIQLAKKTNHKVHILHVTTKQEMEFLKENKAYCTVECTPQHLTLSAPECYEQLGSKAQMNPPIRTIDHQQALWLGIDNSTVDILGSDHAPHTEEEKAKTYPNSPSGMTGVQTILPIMLNHVAHGRLSLEKLVQLMRINPIQNFRIKGKAGIEVGYDADFTIVDLNKEMTITNDWIESKSKWTPFDGKKVKGWPLHTVIEGVHCMAEGILLNRPPQTLFEFERNED